MIRTAVIGCGYWGPNYIRILNQLRECRIEYCCDLEEKNLLRIDKANAGIKFLKDYRDLIRRPDIDAVVITTPLNTHYKIAELCLRSAKHVLLEKPFVPDSAQAKKLIRLAEQKKVVLMVGHVYKYNPAVGKLREIIRKKQLGDIYYVNSERVGLGPIRKYANALWDLATHDVSIALYLLGELPRAVTAAGEYYIQKGIKDLVFISLEFPSRVIYNIYASWLAPEKIRKTTVVGSKAMAVFDDVNKHETIKVYERSIEKCLLNSTPEYSDHQLVVNIGDVYIPKIEQSEPLKNQVRHFLSCILQNKRPLSDGLDGLRVVKILEAAERSLKDKRTVRCR